MDRASIGRRIRSLGRRSLSGTVQRRTPPGPVARYYAFESTQAVAFTLPIFVVFFQFRGLGLAEVGLIEAVYTVVSMLAEGPTGYVGDRLGRRRTLVLSAALAGSGAVGFALAHSLGAFLAVIVVRAIAGALGSGTGEAWLYETLAADEGLDRDRFAAYRGRAGAIARVTTAASVLAGGTLYALAPVAPWVLEGAVVAVGGLLALSMPEPPTVARDGDDDGTATEDPASSSVDTGTPPTAAIRVALRTLVRPGLRRFVAYTAVVLAAAASVHVLVQPAAVALAGLAPGHLGVLYFSMVALAAVGADRTEWIRRRVGIDRWFVLAPLVAGALLAGTLVVGPLVLVAVVAVWTMRAVSAPLVAKYVNDRADGTARATTLSGAAMARRLAIAPAKLAAGGAAAGALGPTVAGLGGVLVLAALAAVSIGGPTGGPDRTVPDATSVAEG